MKKKWIVIFSTALALFTILAVKAQNRRINKKPNIIFILADDLGYGDLSCYGQTKFKTPNIDKLASEGMKFIQAYAGTAVCAPSRSVLFTGLHTGHTPIRGNRSVKPEGQYPIPDSVIILPQLLESSGYATGCFGKWGLGYPGSEGDPVNKGFDEFYGYNCQALAHNYYPYHLWHNKQKVELPENSGQKMGAYAPELIQQQALNFIDKNKDKPFLLFVTSIIPHAEVIAPDTYMQQTRGKYEPETPFKGADPTSANYIKNGKYTSQEQPHAGYAAMVKVLDDQVGQIIDKVKALHLEDNTIIVFSSDNGPSIEGGEDPLFFNSSGSLRGHKRDLYEGGIREPFVVKWPGKIKPGTISNQIVTFWDVLPTLAEVSGINVAFPIDGFSFLPTLTGIGKQKQHEYLYWEFHEQGGSMAIRMGNWKGIRKNVARNPQGPIELYDLSEDLREAHDVATKHSDIIMKMQNLFNTARVPSPIFNFVQPKAAED
jgi:arylsulfatase A